MLKKMLAYLLTAVMVLTMTAGVVSANEPAESMVGKYITFGTYNNVPVTYKVWGTRDVDGDGTDEILVAPENSLFCMAWDSDASGLAGDWETSTLRTYLNDATTGFLSNFTETERSLIVPVTQKTLFTDGANKHGGSKHFANKTIPFVKATTYEEYKTAYENNEKTDYKYDNCFYKNTTDLVFIPSLKDIYDFAIAPYSTVNTHTSGGASNDAIWIRDHQSTEGQNVAKIWRWYKDGRILTDACTATQQVRPTFYLKSDFGGLKTYGTGDKNTPYHLTDEETDNRKGKFIKWGSYKGKDLVYRIEGSSDVDGDGKQELLLVSNRIIDYKPFDADNSNDWGTSDLRAWLNGNEFMSGMNEKELEALAEVTHKYAFNSKNGSDGGWEAHGWNDGSTGSKQAFTNYDIAYYKLATDKVFALSIEDIVRYDIYCPAYPMEGLTAPNSSYQFNWWLRDGNGTSATQVRRYVEWDPIRFADANNTNMGVRPALFIDAEVKLYGAGTEKDLYTVDEKTAGVTDLTVDSDGVITATIYNYTGVEQTFRLIVAEYSNDGTVLRNVCEYPCVISGDVTTQDYPAEAIDLSKDSKYKAFVWGGKDLMEPFSVQLPLN